MKKTNFAIYFFIYFCFLFSKVHSITSDDLQQACPDWMLKQIHQDLSNLTPHATSLNNIDSFFQSHKDALLLVKVSIRNNTITVENPFVHDEGVCYRIKPIIDGLKHLSKISFLPDTTFLLSAHDGLGGSSTAPVFVMSKKKSSCDNLILIPDFENLNQRYQVLEGIDVTQYSYKWSKKQSKLIWRGSSAGISYDDTSYFIKKENINIFPRILLCKLSRTYPHLIDAKLTFFAQADETIPELNQLKGRWLSFQEQFKYKYHILVDGNTIAYSNSTWKFFTNSLVFKQESPWTQWYLDALVPYVHYVPVSRDLNNLVSKIEWAKNSDEEASTIARNAYQFAIQNLTKESGLFYLYHLLISYSQL